MDFEHPVARYALLVVAAIGGAIVSLSLTNWQQMTGKQLGMAIFVGVMFAIFGVPWLVGDIMGADIGPLRVACGITFFGAIAAPSLIPPIIVKIRKWGGLEETGK